MSIKRDTIKYQVTNHIRRLILNKKLKPGERIIPGDLADELNVGRATTREALIELEKEKLVENIPYKHTKVKIITHEEMKEICSIRVLLESFAADLIQNSITYEDIRNLHDIIEGMTDAAKKNDAEQIVSLDEKFHAYIVKMANHKVLYETWHFTNSRLASLFYSAITQDNEYSWNTTITRHLTLIEALESHDIKNFKMALKKHYMQLIKVNYSINIL